MTRVTASEKMDTLEADELPRWITIILREMKGILNNGIRFSDNFDSQILDVTFSAADSDLTVNTRLRRIPTGYIVLGRSAAMAIYNGSLPNKTDVLYLRSNVVGTAKVMVF